MIKITNKMSIFVKILAVFSVPFLVLFLSFRFSLTFRLFTALLAFFIMIFLVRKIKIDKISSKVLLLSFLSSCYIEKLLMSFYNYKINKIINLLVKYIHIKFSWNTIFLLFSVAVFFSLFYFVTLFYIYIIPKVKDFLKKLSKNERKYLTIIFIISFILSIIVSTHTTAFGRNNENYDVIYTSDSSSLVRSDVWININNAENDVRQPLFGLFSLPFGILGHFASEFLFFLPQSARYEFAMMLIQFQLLGFVTIMLSRLVVKDEDMKKYFYALFSLSFPYLIFGLVLEQYVIGLFYLILCIYLYFKKEEKINYAYLGSVGTLLTSGVLCWMTYKTKDFKKWFVNTFKLAIIFLILLIITGQFAQFFTLKERLTFLLRFTGDKVSFINRIYQYLYFVRALFVAPDGFIYYGSFFDQPIHYSYQLIMPSKVSIIGLFILSLSFISLILNRKNKMALLSGFWILFSFIILCLIGWGTQENGLILYSLYFSWAFYILIYLLLGKLVKNTKLLKIIMVIFIIVLTIFNIRELYFIMKFAFTYYVR